MLTVPAFQSCEDAFMFAVSENVRALVLANTGDHTGAQILIEYADHAMAIAEQMFAEACR
jgi:hypothetical protein